MEFAFWFDVTLGEVVFGEETLRLAVDAADGEVVGGDLADLELLSMSA